MDRVSIKAGSAIKAVKAVPKPNSQLRSTLIDRTPTKKRQKGDKGRGYFSWLLMFGERN